MNISSVVIGIGILILIIIPFFLASQKEKRKLLLLKKQFKLYANKYGIDLTISDSWKNREIGMDEDLHKLLFKRKQDQTSHEVLINLNEVKSVSIHCTHMKNHSDTGLIDTIDLIFDFKTKREKEELSFYVSEEQVQLTLELELAEKWKRMCDSITN